MECCLQLILWKKRYKKLNHKKNNISVSKMRKNIYRPRHKLFFSFRETSDVYRSFIPNKTTFTGYSLTQRISKLLGSFNWNPLSKAAPDKFLGSGRRSKHNSLQNQANFHRSWAWQIVIIFDTDIFSPSLWYSSCQNKDSMLVMKYTVGKHKDVLTISWKHPCKMPCWGARTLYPIHCDLWMPYLVR